MFDRLTRLAAATLVVAAAGLAFVGLGPAGPASAAACSSTTGVTVIADFDALGGGVQGKCVAGGGGDDADALFVAAGLPLSYASRQPGFVCRVSGKPASDPCVNTAPANKYWGLWWSDGDAGSTWVYASLGAGSLKIPDGGIVALAWDQVDGERRPNASPTRPTTSPQPGPTSTPTPRPTPQPDSTPTTRPASPAEPGAPAPSATSGPGTTQPSTGAPGEPTAGPGDESSSPTPGDAKKKPGPPASTESSDPSEPATPSASDYPELSEPEPVAAEADSGSDGLPGWVPPVAVLVLFAGAGGVLFLRRRSS